MKKIISLAMCLVLLMSTLVFTQSSVSAETSGDYEYMVVNDGIKITNYTGEATQLIIPPAIDGYSVTEIGDYSFNGNTTLASITIPDGVTSIGRHAFYGCVDLLTINLPDSIIKIEADAFENTGYYINDYNWEDGVLYIDEYLVSSALYAGYEFVTQVKGDYTVKEGTKVIADWAFSNSDELTGITIPDSVKIIGERAFYSCSSLSKISIGNGIEHIGDEAFIGTEYIYDTSNYENNVLYIDDYLITASYYNSDYEKEFEVSGNYTIKSGTRFIVDNAFDDCTLLTSITIPNSVTYIPESVFLGCESLANINVEEFNEYYSSYSGILYNKDKSEILQIPNAITSITLLNNITKIDDYMFADLESLTTVVIPNSVTTIEQHAFENCTSLTDITIPDSVTNIKYYAFSGCSSLTSITIPNGITTIEQCVFRNCTSLTNINLPNNLTSICSDAFYNTRFWNNENNWENDGTVLYIGKYLISGRYYNKYGEVELTSGEYTVKDGTKLISETAFYGCTDLKNITIPSSVTIINDYALGYYWSDTGNSSTEAGGSGYDALISGFTITGHTNTAAQTYANNNGITFIDIDNPITTSSHTHDWKLDSKKAATCTAKGYKIYKCSCGQTKTNDIAAFGHFYKYHYKDATYFAAGYSYKKCLACGSIINYKTYKKLKMKKPQPLYFGEEGKINIFVLGPTGITHYQVQIKGNGRNFKKTFKAEYGNIDKYIKNLSAGKYKIRIRAIAKKGSKKIRSKWTKFKKVTVE